MAKNIPFTAYAKILPKSRDSRRFEFVRSREHIAYLIYTDLVARLSSAVEASPGGSGHWGLAASTSSLSQSVSIVAVKPQFGEEPDMVTIVGFYNGTGTVPYPETSLIHDGKYVTGPAGASGVNSSRNPSAANVADVKALKAAIIAAVISAPMTIIKIEVAGVVYGRGGFHFPH